MAQARENTVANFALVFRRTFMDTIVKRMDSNEAIFKRILDDDEFQALLINYYLERIYRRLHESDSDDPGTGSTTGTTGL